MPHVVVLLLPLPLLQAASRHRCGYLVRGAPASGCMCTALNVLVIVLLYLFEGFNGSVFVGIV